MFAIILFSVAILTVCGYVIYLFIHFEDAPRTEVTNEDEVDIDWIMEQRMKEIFEK